jgi:hypothetical protein
MVRAVLLIAVFVGLLGASAESVDVRNLLAIAGAFAVCWGINRLGER